MHINSKYEIILLPVIKSIIIVIKLNNDIPMVLDIEYVEQLYYKEKDNSVSLKDKKIYLQKLINT